MTETSGTRRLAVAVGVVVSAVVASPMAAADAHHDCATRFGSASGACASPLDLASTIRASSASAGTLAMQSSTLSSLAGPITNADILRMTVDGVAEGAIVDAIRQKASRFDLNSNALITLREQGVSKPILAAMLDSKTRRGAPSITVADAPPPSTENLASPAATLARPKAVVPVPEALAPTTGIATFDLSVFRGTRRLLISANRIEYQANDFQGRPQAESFVAECDALTERKPGRFERSLQLRLKSGRRYTFDVSKEQLAGLMAALAEACG
jgi:hypothetical protein